jgi:putative ABC transport system permease protein
MGRAARGRPALRSRSGPWAHAGARRHRWSCRWASGSPCWPRIGQIDGNLRRAIADELPAVAPTYFFVDIQPDQIDGFLDRSGWRPRVSRVDSAPMLRGVITEINGRRPHRGAAGHWVVRGDRGVTYSANCPNTRLTERRMVARGL